MKIFLIVFAFFTLLDYAIIAMGACEVWLHEVDFHLAASAFLLGVDFSLIVATIIIYTRRKK